MIAVVISSSLARNLVIQVASRREFGPTHGPASTVPRVATVENGRPTGRRASDWGKPGTRLVDRDALLAALDRAVTHKVTVISAPAGSGKSSLLRAWADRPGQTHRVAFVTVRRDQRDEQLFWLTLLQAIQATLDEENAEEPLVATPVFNADAMVQRVLAYLADYPGRL